MNCATGNEGIQVLYIIFQEQGSKGRAFNTRKKLCRTNGFPHSKHSVPNIKSVPGSRLALEDLILGLDLSIALCMVIG